MTVSLVKNKDVYTWTLWEPTERHLNWALSFYLDVNKTVEPGSMTTRDTIKHIRFRIDVLTWITNLRALSAFSVISASIWQVSCKCDTPKHSQDGYIRNMLNSSQMQLFGCCSTFWRAALFKGGKGCAISLCCYLYNSPWIGRLIIA